MKTIQVKARKGVLIPTPYGGISDVRWVKVPNDIYIRRRIAEGDLIVKGQNKNPPRSPFVKVGRSPKKRRKS